MHGVTMKYRIFLLKITLCSQNVKDCDICNYSECDKFSKAGYEKLMETQLVNKFLAF